ncbi:serine protease [Rhizobium sp. L9]|uniref:S1 family peptidase n=1 Tax=Rhizobium sp. L9 TaxID=1340738 RepID=UPI001596B007|nr:serine protease [Rhizobium sp. L9]
MSKATTLALMVMTFFQPLKALATEPKEYLAAKQRQKVGTLSQKIVGGEKVSSSEKQWQVALVAAGSDDRLLSQFCSGSYLGSGFVLTAAHCVLGLSPDNFFVLSGTRNLSIGGDVSSVVKIVVHDAYNDSSLPPKVDIALLKIDPPQGLTGVGLANASVLESVAGKSIEVSGWGLTDPFRAQSKSEDLLKVYLPVQSNDSCNAIDAYNGAVTETMMCAGTAAGLSDSCLGDSGGPATIGTGSEQRLLGVVSFGEGCGAPKKYGIYTAVPYFIKWIGDKVSLN